MQSFQQWLIASSMSWRGLRWGAAAISLVAHGAAASFAWVMIETKPAQVIDAFTVELVSVDQNQGAVKKHQTISDAVTAHKADTDSKTDNVRAAVASPALAESMAEPIQQPVKKSKSPHFEIEIAHVASVEPPKTEHRFPKAEKPKISFPIPPQKPKVNGDKKSREQQQVKKPVDGPIEVAKQRAVPDKPNREEVPSQVASLSSQGGVGGGARPSKGEAVPMTAASYSIGTLGNKPPEYPERARLNEFEGRVLLRVKVSADGKSEKVAIKTTSGYDILDEAAKAAVQAWRFVPARRAGIAVAATIDVPIVFRLTNSP
ncbi:MAG: energy transducer TonB [Rhodospirillaceae bacterium]|jgi:protein TonB